MFKASIRSPDYWIYTYWICSYKSCLFLQPVAAALQGFTYPKLAGSKVVRCCAHQHVDPTCLQTQTDALDQGPCSLFCWLPWRTTVVSPTGTPIKTLGPGRWRGSPFRLKQATKQWSNQSTKCYRLWMNHSKHGRKWLMLTKTPTSTPVNHLTVFPASTDPANDHQCECGESTSRHETFAC